MNTYWNLDTSKILHEMESTPDGISTEEAGRRLQKVGPNVLKPRRRFTTFQSLAKQFTSPLVLILLFAAVVSLVAGEWTDAIIVILIVLASGLLSFVQEFRAGKAVERLQAQVVTKAVVLRDGKPMSIPAGQIVPGDILMLSAGSLIPADGIVLDAKDFFVNQAVLTGETFPVEKKEGPVPADAELTERINSVFMGTNVRSGTAKALVVRTGADTMFGEIAERLKLRPPETEFEHGIRKFGILLTKIMTVLVVAVLIINIILNKPPIDSLLFAIALAVGIAPELLPAIITINLSKGAQLMSKSGVIVRQLNAIENLGSMDILCTDKTGTITVGVVSLDGALDTAGAPSEDVMRLAFLNAAFQTGIANPLDEAILASKHTDVTGIDKLEEIPYDFQRKRLSVVVDSDPGTAIRPLLISKGALDNVLSICTSIQVGKDAVPFNEGHRAEIKKQFAGWSEQGYRVLGIAAREVARKAEYTVKLDEREMTFSGFLLFFDPPKPGVAATIESLKQLGVQIKVITGDNHLVARHLAESVGLPVEGIITANEIKEMNDEALWHAAERMTVFAEVDPVQKERIILALRKMGHVVGYMGDGINDAPALHSADVGISVEQAVDVAKDAADFVLLSQDLDLLVSGIKEGRRTFANTLKYIFTTTSANFGNMLSMAGASLFLPFLPLLAKQILLNNFLSDIPAIGIPGDNVDEDQIKTPHRWNMRFIRNFMIIFGLVSSVFDYATFGMLLFILKATESQFQTAWFIESLLTELVIALVVRTRFAFYKSRPGKALLWLTIATSVVTFALPYLPFNHFLGFTPLPAWVIAALIGLTALYVVAAEIAKKYFYAHASL
ncbi:magnesium-translocating P-type ATPase [Parasporobacterium paucivorans]|uniref:Magnesium-transporting ATPase, P-type 1 n=1 Tax=Parasporobacterium paucivorans DSM 15970 TaxID=1122934 RepID=A0A1M6JYU3_9FIRM|nr:magnesium-translocating P-type ATPase [Parasporobacterium paucivorans]SHJ51846.1 Mg2+-importing ATPase [Parasporobacterium paucivorans DSM 15970]